ncbi:MAG: hypothetical protein KBE23_16260 [Chloroflexi bacterium]|nr:hypothetical protein [Chloroflexota bacterium]
MVRHRFLRHLFGDHQRQCIRLQGFTFSNGRFHYSSLSFVAGGMNGRFQ